MSDQPEGVPVDEWETGGVQYRTVRFDDGALLSQVLFGDAWEDLSLTMGSGPLESLRFSAEMTAEILGMARSKP